MPDEQKEVSKIDKPYVGVYETMLTTEDNPYNPFDQFDDWFRYDEQAGYHTCSYLGRIARFSDEMSEEEVLAEQERAIDEILMYDFTNNYRKVKRIPENLD